MCCTRCTTCTGQLEHPQIGLTTNHSRQIFRRPGNFNRSVVQRAGRFTSCKRLSLVSFVNFCSARSSVLTPPVTAYHVHPGPFCWLLCSFSGHFYRWHIVSALTRDAELSPLFPCVCVCVCLAWCVLVRNSAFNKNKFLAYSSRWYGYCSCSLTHHPSLLSMSAGHRHSPCHTHTHTHTEQSSLEIPTHKDISNFHTTCTHTHSVWRTQSTCSINGLKTLLQQPLHDLQT